MIHPPQEGSDRILDIWHTSGCLMVDVPYLGHLWDGQKDCLDVGQVRCYHEETSRNYFSGREIQMTSMPRQRGVTEFQPNRA